MTAGMVAAGALGVTGGLAEDSLGSITWRTAIFSITRAVTSAKMKKSAKKMVT